MRRPYNHQFSSIGECQPATLRQLALGIKALMESNEPRKTFLLRMDPKLWADLEAWAKDELRSVNGQIEYLLRQAVLKRKGGKEAADERR